MPSKATKVKVAKNAAATIVVAHVTHNIESNKQKIESGKCQKVYYRANTQLDTLKYQSKKHLALWVGEWKKFRDESLASYLTQKFKGRKSGGTIEIIYIYLSKTTDNLDKIAEEVDKFYTTLYTGVEISQKKQNKTSLSRTFPLPIFTSKEDMNKLATPVALEKV